jgi:dTDP-4-amino-4,6-dideoxygalactose transaminase
LGVFKKSGIVAKRIYHPLHLQAPYVKKPRYFELPHAEAVSDRALMIPSSPNLSEIDQDRVIESLLTLE